MKEKLTELKEEIDNSTVVVGVLKIPFSIMDRMTRQKINKEIEYMYTVNPLDVLDIFRALCIS